MTRTLFLIFLLACENCNAQLDNRWLFGYASFGGPPYGGTDLVFVQNQLDSVNYHYRDMNFEYANASICDSVGKLLFYTNGIYIANALDDTMLNGSGLNPSFYTTNWNTYGLNIQQADIIIQKPGSDSLYYLFHETIDDGGIYKPDYLYYSIINMKGDSGRGEVISKNNALINDTLVSGSLTACKHANGRDWWIAVPSFGTDAGIYLVLVTPDSIELFNHQTFPVDGTQGGQACFAPDGSIYVWNNWFEMDFFNFDRCSGSFSLLDDTVYADGFGWLGTSVSPNSRYCYVSHGLYLFQYDLQSSDITSSVLTVAEWDSFADPFNAFFWLQQIAPDGKIYLSTGNGTKVLHCIDQPDSADTLCNYLQHSIDLQRYNTTIPNFPNYNLGPLLGSVCDSLGLGVEENAASSFNIRISPNPCINYFYLNYDIATNKNLLFVLYDDFGKEVLRRNLYGTTKYLLISTQGLSDGVYFGVVSDGVWRETVKVVVIKS